MFDKIIHLKNTYGLTNAVLAERFGVSVRTIKVYVRAAKSNTVPYKPTEKVLEG